ncbi:hypothetical protein KPL71_004921 [Citrus sinensis]|uniref:Uncharacterized protein n=1 Tax=Citrus sinensis TaxID=2711 RepID=A0ACB8N9L6_CITSI|nr:hypothetical protein KPL71_004921 [Citrus sinensis]
MRKPRASRVRRALRRERDAEAASISRATGAASRARCPSRTHLACEGRCVACEMCKPRASRVRRSSVTPEMRAAFHAACAHLTHMHLQHHTTNNNDIPNNNNNPNNSNNINNINNNKNGNNNSPRVFNFSRPGLKCCRSTPPLTIYTTSGDEILTGRLQQTLAGFIEKTGKTLHSGNVSMVRLCPEFAGKGRYFEFRSRLIPASIDFAKESPLCTTLFKDGVQIRTVEHLLSALEAKGVDNCKIEILNMVADDQDVEAEVPIFDGSASAWAEAIEQVGLKEALDCHGNNAEKVAPFLNQPIYVQREDSFVAAFPSQKVQISYGIDFPQAANGFPQLPWKALAMQCILHLLELFAFMRRSFSFSQAVALHHSTGVERMCNAGLIKGGSLDNAIVCSASEGWLNPPLRFPDEPCRHKLLDFVGDLSLFARNGSQGLPVAHMVAFKACVFAFSIFPMMYNLYSRKLLIVDH